MDKNILEILSKFDTISLGDLSDDIFNTRRDTKYLAHRKVLSQLLEEFKDDWKVLEVDGLRQHFYVSKYFDDPELTSFYDHLKERNNRQKFRFRKYANNSAFFEIKTKNNKGITEKDRLNVNAGKDEEIPIDFIKGKSDRDLSNFESNIVVKYNRITLLNEDTNEKITIDTDISFEENDVSKAYNNLLILELKQEAFNKKLVTRNKLRALGLKLNPCSKYCVGILNLRNDVRHNRFKTRLRILDKIEKEAV